MKVLWTAVKESKIKSKSVLISNGYSRSALATEYSIYAQLSMIISHFDDHESSDSRHVHFFN